MKSQPISLIGLRIKGWILVECVDRRLSGSHLWACRCVECGHVQKIETDWLVEDGSVPCNQHSGAFLAPAPEVIPVIWPPMPAPAPAVNPPSDPELLRTTRNIWYGMIYRCYREDCNMYRCYGAKGIKVCDRWRYSFKNFLADMGPRPSKEHSIDRYPDGEGNYEPSNCRWATRAEQMDNRHNTLWITIDGQTQSLRAWSKVSGVPAWMIRNRFMRGTPAREAVFTPLKNSSGKKKSAPKQVRPTSALAPQLDGCQTELVTALLAQGYSCSDVGNLLGIPDTTVAAVGGF